MMNLSKKTITCALICALSFSSLSLSNVSAATAADDYTVSGASNYDSTSSDDDWEKDLCNIYYNGTVVGTVSGHFYDNLVTDKVQSSCTALSTYSRYATVVSKTSSSGSTVKTGSAYSGKVTLANNSATFAGVVTVS